MKVEFSNLYKSHRNHKKIIYQIKKLIKKNQFIGGPEVKSFEENFSKYIGAKHCIGVANGTDALEIALESLKLKKESEVIIPANTWIATASSVVRAGYKLVFCDINLNDYCIDVKDLKNKITSKTKVIIPVHLYGHPAKLDQIKKIAKKKKLIVIEDCAQAHGTKYKNKYVGTYGDLSAFSFYPGKNLGAYGDAGAIITNNRILNDRCRRIRYHGSLKTKYDFKLVGRNSRLDSIQASILNIKLNNLNNQVRLRNVLARIYKRELNHLKMIKLPHVEKYAKHSFHQFVIRLNERNKLKNFLKIKKIDTMIHYPCMLNEIKFYRKVKGQKTLINSKGLGRKILSLPISEEHTKKQILYICKQIKNFCKFQLKEI